MRGILKTFSYVLPKKLRASYIASVREIEGNATLEPIVMPMLKTLAATMEQLQVYDRSVHRIAREDETARHLMARRIPQVAEAADHSFSLFFNPGNLVYLYKIKRALCRTYGEIGRAHV